MKGVDLTNIPTLAIHWYTYKCKYIRVIWHRNLSACISICIFLYQTTVFVLQFQAYVWFIRLRGFGLALIWKKCPVISVLANRSTVCPTIPPSSVSLPMTHWWPNPVFFFPCKHKHILEPEEVCIKKSGISSSLEPPRCCQSFSIYLQIILRRLDRFEVTTILHSQQTAHQSIDSRCRCTTGLHPEIILTSLSHPKTC